MLKSWPSSFFLQNSRLILTKSGTFRTPLFLRTITGGRQWVCSVSPGCWITYQPRTGRAWALGQSSFGMWLLVNPCLSAASFFLPWRGFSACSRGLQAELRETIGIPDSSHGHQPSERVPLPVQEPPGPWRPQSGELSPSAPHPPGRSSTVPLAGVLLEGPPIGWHAVP